MSSPKCIVFPSVIAVILILITSCVSTPTYDVKQSAVNDVEQLLSATQKHASGSLPKSDLASYLWVSEDCWTLVQSEMNQNSGQHTTKVTYYNQDSPNYNGRDVYEVDVDVSFPDGKNISVLYYEGGLQGCR